MDGGSSFPSHSSNVFLARVTDKDGTGPSAAYAFVEVWATSGGSPAVEKVASGRTGALGVNPGFSATGGELEIDAYVLARGSDAGGGLRWELVPIASASDEVLYRGSTLVRVLNNSGSAIPVRSIVRTFTPVDEAGAENATTDPEGQQARPLLLLTPASLDSQHDDYGWGVTVGTIVNGVITPGPIPDGEIGVIIVQGIAVVDVYVPPAGSGAAVGPRAEPAMGALGFLQASLGGSAKVMWPNPFPGSGQVYRSVVLLEGRVPAGAYYEYRTDCEVVDGFADPVNVRYRRLIDLKRAFIGPWEFDSYQGCCGCSDPGSSGGSGGPPPSGPDNASFTPTSGIIPQTITDGDCVNVPIVVSGLDAGATLSALALAMTHPNVGGLRITLTNPGGRRATLVDKLPWGTGDSTADGLDVQLRDSAGAPIEDQSKTSGTIGGVFAPVTPLSSLADGSDPNGTYLLEICSDGPGGPGSLTALTLCFGTDPTAADFTVEASVDDDEGPLPFTVAVDATFTGGTPDYVEIDWGDGTTGTDLPSALPASHTYTEAGIYEIVVKGTVRPCGASASDSVLVYAGGVGGTLGGCAVGAVLHFVPSTTCMGGALNSQKYALVKGGDDHWTYSAGGPVAGGGVSSIDLYDVAGSARMDVLGNCADGSQWSATLTQDSITCSPLSINLGDGTMTGSATCGCSGVSFNGEVTEV